MKAVGCILGAALLLAAFPATAQPAPRIKAKLVGFDGHVLTLQPLHAAPQAPQTESKPRRRSLDSLFGGPATPPADTAKPADAIDPGETPISVAILPETRIVTTAKAALTDAKPGMFAGAAVIPDAKGALQAQEVVIYPEALRGSGEGRFPEGDRIRINGLVTDMAAGRVTLHYRGAVLTGSLCEGRAGPRPFASPLACIGDAVIEVAAGTPVTALTLGDAALLVPGALVSVSLAKNSKGDSVTPGIVIESPNTLEKPPSSP